jgi:large subunit ribosomal protein L9
MEVILLERITRLGGVGDVVKVKNGYARNFLIPMKKALRASEDNKKVFEERRHEIEAQNAKLKAAAEAIFKKLDALTLSLVRQASQEGKLYGSVTVRDIAEAFESQGHEVPKSQIVLTTAIKNTGDYTVRVTLHPDVIANVKVNVARSEASDAA